MQVIIQKIICNSFEIHCLNWLNGVPSVSSLFWKAGMISHGGRTCSVVWLFINFTTISFLKGGVPGSQVGYHLVRERLGASFNSSANFAPKPEFNLHTPWQHSWPQVAYHLLSQRLGVSHNPFGYCKPKPEFNLHIPWHHSCTGRPGTLSGISFGAKTIWRLSQPHWILHT